VADQELKDIVKKRFADLMRPHLSKNKHCIKVLAYKNEVMKDYYSFRVFHQGDDFSRPPLLEMNIPIIHPDKIPQIWKGAELLRDKFYTQWKQPKLLE